MRHTSRWVNRVFLGFVGLILAVAGAATLLYATLPSSRAVIDDVRDLPREWLRAAGSDLPLPARWWAWGLAALAVLLVVCMLVLRTQGGGKSPVLLRVNTRVVQEAMPQVDTKDEARSRHTQAGRDGVLQIDTKVASDVIESILADARGVVSVKVEGYGVARGTVLLVSIGLRRGTDVRRVEMAARRALKTWDQIAGMNTQAVVRIERARTARIRKSSRAA